MSFILQEAIIRYFILFPNRTEASRDKYISLQDTAFLNILIHLKNIKLPSYFLQRDKQ